MADPPGSLARCLRRAGAVAVCLVALVAVRADEPAKSGTKAPAAEAGKANGRTLDPAKLPPGAVIVISDNPRDALQNVEAVVLSPEEYKKLLDAAEQARKLAAPDKPEPPSVCRLSGRVETRGAQEVAVLRAEFQFRTIAPRATVLLGLQKAKPTAATIDDGKLAVLVPLKDEDGYAVQVDAPGEHKVAVDLEAPLAGRGTKGGERGIDLGLPGAAITTIERLELPAGVARVRVAGRSLQARQLIPSTGNAPAVVLGSALGPVTKLELTWEGPAPAGKTETLLAAEGRYDVRVEERAVTTRAQLTLKVLGGTADVFHIQAPAAAEVTPAGAASTNGGVRVERPRDPKDPVWAVHRDAASAEDLVVEVYLKTDATPGKPVSVPVFPVQKATQQRGTLTVGGPPHLRLTFKPSGDLTRREGPDESSRDAVFAYYRLPESGTPLEIEVQPARGEVETQTSHQLTLTERGWRWQGKIDVRPVRTEVMALDLDVPAELQELRPASAELVESLTPQRDLGPGRRLVRVQLAEARRRPFTITLEGLYPSSAAAGTAALPLPRPLGTLDRGGQVGAAAPAGLELRGSLREWEHDRPGDWEKPLDPAPRGAPGLTAAVDRAPARVDLSWRSPRGDLAVTAAVDVRLGEHQASVRHQWRIPAGPAVPRQVTVRGPAGLAGRLQIVDGGVLTPGGPGEWSVQLPPLAGRDHTLTLTYGFPLPAGPVRPPVAVPLVWLDPCPRCETVVRVWAGATPDGVLVPALADGPWTELPPQPVPDSASLPALVLHGSGPNLPLSLGLRDAGPGPGTSLVVEHAWVQALVDEDGQQFYRARYLVRPQHTHYLDVELPASPLAIQLAALLDGKQMRWQPAENRTVRLRLDPEPGRAARVLELDYVLVPRRAESARGPSRWQMTLAPPRLRGPVFVGPLRWQVGLASGDLALFLGDGADFEQRWGWQRGLFAPLPAWTAAALQQWFYADARPAEADPADGLETALVAWAPAAEPLRFLVVPRTLALLIGSLAVAALGLAAARWAGPRALLGGAVAFAAAVVWLGVSRPQPLTVLLYAAQPGVAALAVALGARWLLQRRYRRRVLFLPGFTRQPASGSSLLHGGSGARARREPTTIDAPASSS
jgi:hypothetical protein